MTRIHFKPLILLVLMSAHEVCAAPVDLLKIGRQLYEQGTLPDGSAVRARGAGGVPLAAHQAACASCHRRSGMGSREGSQVVPPIAATILFNELSPAKPALRRGGRIAQPVSPLRHEARPAYDDAALARALHQGLDPGGRPLKELMPRYTLDEQAQRGLTAYLRQLSRNLPAGLDSQIMHLATIVTPDADPGRATVTIDTLSTWAQQAGILGLKVRLHVWRLSGPPGTWEGQLDAFYQAQPVYSVLSGVGAATWQPVHTFCQRTALPCLLPSLDLAPSEPGFYALYYCCKGHGACPDGFRYHRGKPAAERA
jgi:hypothetical protein